VIPEYFIEEMKALDDNVSDKHPLFTDILSDFLFFDISKGHIMRKVVSSKLNVKLADLLPEIVAETTYAMNLKLPPTDDWTTVNINHELPEIVSLISGGIFISSPLNRDDEWMETNIAFSEDIYAAGVVLKERSYLHKLITVWFSTCP
jgi:cytochrome P450